MAESHVPRDDGVGRHRDAHRPREYILLMYVLVGLGGLADWKHVSVLETGSGVPPEDKHPGHGGGGGPLGAERTHQRLLEGLGNYEFRNACDGLVVEPDDRPCGPRYSMGPLFPPRLRPGRRSHLGGQTGPSAPREPADWPPCARLLSAPKFQPIDLLIFPQNSSCSRLAGGTH